MHSPFSCNLVALSTFVLGVQAAYKTRFPNVTWNDNQWTLQTTSLDQGHYQSRVSLANGYLGINVAALGPFFEVDSPVDGDNINGWPLFERRQTFATVAGFYDYQPTTNGSNFPWLYQYGGESVISGVPHWGGLLLESNGHLLNANTPPSQIANFHTALNMRSGTFTWDYTWTPQAGSDFDISYTMFVNKLYVNQATIRLTIKPSANGQVTVYDVLDGDCAVRTVAVGKGDDLSSGLIWTAVSPANIPDVIAHVYSTTLVNNTVGSFTRAITGSANIAGANSSSNAQAITLQLVANERTTIQKFVGVASSDAFDNPQSIARDASTDAATAGFRKLHNAHVTEWKSIMLNDSIDSFHLPETGNLPADPNIVEQQIQAVVNNFFLLQNTVSQNAIDAANSTRPLDDNSIAVGGLGSSSYAGQIFWDADVWMAPGLVVAFPEAARQISNYRLAKYPQAKANVHTAFESSQANTTFSTNSAVYSWTSARFGNCTAVGPCFDYEYHLNGDIALALENYYYVTGDAALFESQYWPIYDSVAQLYSDLLRFNSSSNLYVFLNGTDPDEYANFVDNPLYTMALIRTVLQGANRFRKQFGMAADATFTRQAAALTLSADPQAGIYLEYTGMNGNVSVKQADVILIDDFLDYDNNYTVTDLDYYAGRQSIDGPAMTFGVFSIVAAESSPSGCSDYTYDLVGTQPYTRGPWFQFSEQLTDDYTSNGGTHPAFPFLTGMGGANRITVFGFLGLRLRGDSLNIDPTLPPQIPYLRYRTIYWQGHAISASANSTHTTITRLPSSRALATANPAYANAAIPVTIAFNATIYNLEPNGALIFPTRDPSAKFTIANNLAQCHAATSSTLYTPGQFPLAAVDGATSTTWQPVYPSTNTSSLTVTLGPSGIAPIASIYLNWALAPPAYFTVYFTNSSHPKPHQLRSATGTAPVNVSISNPYVAMDAAEIVLPVGNTTNVTLSNGIWGGMYAVLSIGGSLTGGNTGPSVAEFAVVRAV